MSRNKEDNIKKKIADAVQDRFPLVNGTNLEFLQGTRKKLVKPVNTSCCDFKHVKLLARQGAIYVKLNENFPFLLQTIELKDFDDDASIKEETEREEKVNCDKGKPGKEVTFFKTEAVEQNQPDYEEKDQSDNKLELDLDQVIMLVEHCKNNSISDPTEILREAQKVIVQRRKLDLTSTVIV